MKIYLHVDFNSYFATVEQQANPRLRGKPIGITGGDRNSRTVVSTASIEAKRLGVKTGMSLQEALKIYPQLILVTGDSEKYFSTTKKFINILKDYSDSLEIFSIDECFLELSNTNFDKALKVAEEIKLRIRQEVGEWITCSIGVSYNKLIAKLAGSLQKPDGLVVIEDSEAAMMILDQLPLDEVCGIGFRLNKRLNNLGIFNFSSLRQIPESQLIASFKQYGSFLYNICRGIDTSTIVPFHDKEEVKSIGHRHTLYHDSSDEREIKQILLKITELIARRLRAKKLVGKTVVCYFRYAKNYEEETENYFTGDGMQLTISFTQDGLDIFNGAWDIFHQLWNGGRIRMIGATVSNLRPTRPENLSLLEEKNRQEIMNRAIDKVNDKFGEFTLERGVLLNSAKVYRKPNPYLSDRRLKFQ